MGTSSMGSGFPPFRPAIGSASTATPNGISALPALHTDTDTDTRIREVVPIVRMSPPARLRGNPCCRALASTPCGAPMGFELSMLPFRLPWSTTCHMAICGQQGRSCEKVVLRT